MNAIFMIGMQFCHFFFIIDTSNVILVTTVHCNPLDKHMLNPKYTSTIFLFCEYILVAKARSSMRGINGAKKKSKLVVFLELLESSLGLLTIEPLNYSAECHYAY